MSGYTVPIKGGKELSNNKFYSQVYAELLEWPEEYRPFVVIKPQPKKDTIEVTVFFTYEGKIMRSDQEIATDVLEHPNPNDWDEEEIADFMEAVWIMFNANLRDWEVNER